MTSLAKWLSMVDPEDGFVLIIIDDNGWLLMMSDHIGFHRVKMTEDEYPMMGIHSRNVRVYLNREKHPDWVLNQVDALCAAYGSASMPLD